MVDILADDSISFGIIKQIERIKALAHVHSLLAIAADNLRNYS